jgi:hypothetical protein
MDAAVIYMAAHRIPFLPFTLIMNDGREFYVRHPELVAVAGTSVFLIDDRTERGIYLERTLIASMQLDQEHTPAS